MGEISCRFIIVLIYRIILKMCVESNPSLFRLCFTSLCGCSRKLALFSQPIRCKTKTNRTFVTRVFARFTQVIRFYSAFSLAPCDIFPSFLFVLRYSIEKRSIDRLCSQQYFSYCAPRLTNDI